MITLVIKFFVKKKKKLPQCLKKIGIFLAHSNNWICSVRSIGFAQREAVSCVPSSTDQQIISYFILIITLFIQRWQHITLFMRTINNGVAFFAFVFNKIEF